jgi:hypothetical protein
MSVGVNFQLSPHQLTSPLQHQILYLTEMINIAVLTEIQTAAVPDLRDCGGRAHGGRGVRVAHPHLLCTLLSKDNSGNILAIYP